MNSIKKKLNSNSGISILFALVTFMVSAMVCVTIIVTANSTMKRSVANKENTQANLTLESSIKLISKSISNVTYTINGSYDSKTNIFTPNKSSANLSGVDSSLSSYISDICYQMVSKYNNSVDSFNSDYVKLFTISAKYSDYSMEDVTVSYKIRKVNDQGDIGFIVYFKLETADSNNVMYIKYNDTLTFTNSNRNQSSTQTWTSYEAGSKE